MTQSKLYNSALARFKTTAEAKYTDTKDRAILYDFLREKGTPEDAKKAAETLQVEAGSKYGSSRSVGDTKIPQEWISNILGNIGTFIEVGNYATTGAPESVGLAWMAVRLTLSAIQNNYELYNFFGTGLSDISEIMILIPTYDRLYDERDKGGWKPSPVVEKLFNDIIEAYVAVLDFSLTIKRHLKGGVVDRIRHGFKDFFGVQKGKFEGKLAAIATLKKKILEGSDAAFQERSLENLDGMKEVMSDVRATVDRIQAFQPTLQRFHDEQMAGMDELQKSVAKMDGKLDGIKDELKDVKAWIRPKSPWELAIQEFDKIKAVLKPMKDTRGVFQAFAEQRFPGTCEWVFDDIWAYTEWQQSKTAKLLCITGAEGTGKSTLLSVIVSRLEKQSEETKPVLLHVSCDESSLIGTSSASRSASSVCYTLLYQLCAVARENESQDARLLELCTKAFQNPKKSSSKSTDQKSKQTRDSHHRMDDDLPEFASTLKKLVDLIKVDVLVVVDAVDSLSSESQKELSENFARLLEAFHTSKESGIKLRILVGSARLFEVGETRSVDVGEYNASDIVLKLSASLRDVPGLSVEEQELAKEKILEKAGNRFGYLEKAIKFMREPLQRPLENHLKLLPEVGTRDKYNEELLKMGPNYVRLLRNALTWALLGEVWPPVEVVMEDFSKVYTTFSSGNRQDENPEPGFPPPSQLDMEQLKEASGPFLSFPQFGDSRVVVVPDFEQVWPYCMEEPPNAEEHTGGELCARCQSEITQSRSISISGKEGHLELAITCLRHLNNPLFQRRAELVDDAASQGEDALEEDTPRKEDSVLDEAGEQPQETLTSNNGTEPKENEELHENEELQENEDGYDSDDFMGDDDQSEGSIGGNDMYDGGVETKPTRYEIQHWPYHLRRAEDQWTPEERSKSDSWTQLFSELDKLVYENRGVFNSWQRKYQKPSYDTFNLEKPRQPLHVASYLGLVSWAEHLINEKGEDPNGLSGKCNALQAAACGATDRYEMLELLLEKGGDVNAETEESRPAFHTWLSGDSSLKSVRSMIEHGADPALKSKERGWTALHHFANEGTDPEALDLLISKGADVNAATKDGITPLYLLLLRREVPLPLLRAFVHYKADVNVESVYDSYRPLQLASMWGELESLRIIFEPGIEEIDDENNNGDTALQEAAVFGHKECLRFLAEKGADIDHANKRGRTALHQAAWNGEKDCVSVLLEYSANPNKLDKHDRTPFFFACLGDSEETANIILDELLRLKVPLPMINKPTVRKRTPLRQAASHGFNEIIKKLVDAAKADECISDLAIDQQDVKKGMTALHRAAARGHLEAVRLLLDAGADVKLKDTQDKTALALAYENWALRHNPAVEETVSLLVEKDSEAASADAELAAVCAINGSTRLLKQLRRHGADLSRQDQYGWSPLELAKKFQQSDTEAYLKQQAAWANLLPSRWVNPPSKTVVSEDGLNITHSTRERLCVSTDKPLPAGLDRYYFEVTVKELSTQETQSPSWQSNKPPIVAIGFCTLGSSAITFPGWEPNKNAPSAKSWGYHSDDGGMYKSLEAIEKKARNQCYGPGDTVGCGVDFVKNTSWFTRNGERWEFSFSGVQGRLFPIVGLHDITELETNFSGPFKWRDGDDVNEMAVAAES